ncbi:N-formylglutamate amidohydrolase [Qipengyuania soli]|uniref:N-formylglutamate amidohydrolase n=1 Tax=Qipengyuania soli TaxID=2782568 RepID=A0A7S8F6Z9_9SPHN|nr:N-formylglutamate amidohydrolase [Qipengyuania soli]QPD00299.1 N-formylglutamate amidohydrolase [Qipengyuania soli]
MDGTGDEFFASLVPGGEVPGTGLPAFRSSDLRKCALPIVVAAPHGGRSYPASLLADMRNESVRIRLEDRFVDLLALEIARQTGAALLLAEAPRAMIDLNRAPDDVDWGMVSGKPAVRTRNSLANRRARSGLGLVPRRLPAFGEIWRSPISHEELGRRVSTIHQPYHRELGKMLDLVRDQWGAALLIDLHSMPPLKPRFSEERAAEFVVGDRFGASCNERLTSISLRYLEDQNRPAARNRPYSGGYVLDRHGHPQRGVHALQLEVCRSSYLCSRLDGPSMRLPALARMLSGMVRGLAREVAAIGGASLSPLAAE